MRRLLNLSDDGPMTEKGLGCTQKEKPRIFKVGRKCKQCHKRLSKFNPSRYCFIHFDGEFQA